MLKFDDDDGDREDCLTVVASCVILSVRDMGERANGASVNLRRQNAHKTTCQMSSRHQSTLEERSFMRKTDSDETVLHSYSLLSSSTSNVPIKRRIYDYMYKLIFFF